MTTKRIRKTKQEILDELDKYKETTIKQSQIISEMQYFQVNLEQEYRDRIKQETHLNLVFSNLEVSKTRIGLAMEVLYPLQNMEVTTPKFVEDKVIKIANSVVGNELTKITKQQLKEAEKVIKVL